MASRYKIIRREVEPEEPKKGSIDNPIDGIVGRGAWFDNYQAKPPYIDNSSDFSIAVIFKVDSGLICYGQYVYSKREWHVLPTVSKWRGKPIADSNVQCWMHVPDSENMSEYALPKWGIVEEEEEDDDDFDDFFASLRADDTVYLRGTQSVEEPSIDLENLLRDV